MKECGGVIKPLDLDGGEAYRFELRDYGCGGGEEGISGPYLTFEAEDESATLSLEHTRLITTWLALWNNAHMPHWEDGT